METCPILEHIVSSKIAGFIEQWMGCFAIKID